jgi:transcriptional regulator with PAS, ATPase and Fis domain
MHVKDPAGAGAAEIVGSSDASVHLRSMIEALARHDCTVLIEGESGSGKELTARCLHQQSRRRDGPFVPVDCTTLTERLFESQLFGHVRGAFTGADRSTLGFFRAAEGGTLFLDEIGEMALPIQAKLLRCVQDRAVVPLGQTSPVRVNVRIIAATNRKLHDMVGRGEFREDLYFRLNVATLNVPPLRQRRDDIPLLATHLLDDLCRVYQYLPARMSRATIDALCEYRWPGNVRELMNAIEHAVIFRQGDSAIEPCDLPDAVVSRNQPRASREDGIVPLAQAERELIRRTLHVTRGNQARAAALLAIERHRLHRRIVEYGLQDMLRSRA